MALKELFKILILSGLYLLIAPALGWFIRNRRPWQKAAFALMCFMTIGGFLQAANWGLTLGSIPYRGHAQGFHFFFAEIFAISLILGKALGDWKNLRILPPGLWLYILYCTLSLISIVNAPEPGYALMAGFKAYKVILIFLAACNFLRSEEDLHFFLKVMVVTMVWEMVVVLKMKYIDGIYQVPGTFEHQNPLSMFSTMIGMVLLAASLAPRHSWANHYLFGYIACAVIQQATLSRAGLAVFAAGTVAVAALSLLEKFDRRRLAVLCSLAAVGTVGLAMTLDTIVARFDDYGNESSYMTRKMLNEAASNMLNDHWLGIGWNNFGVAINKPFYYGRLIDDWERAGGATVDEDAPKGIAESHYWLLLSETGFQGLLSYLLFILVFLWFNLRAIIAFRYHFLGSLSLGIAMGCACNYAQSFFERVLTQPRNMMLWMILLAISSAIEIWRRQAKRKRKHKHNQQKAAQPPLAAPSGNTTRPTRPTPSPA